MAVSVREDTTEPESLNIPISFNYRKITKVIDTALALLARDWRGPGTGTEMSNGVIRW